VAPSDPTAVPVLDLFDLIRGRLHKPPAEPKPGEERKVSWVFRPVVGYNPATGLGLGVGLSSGFFRGDPATTRISSILTGVKATTEGQLIFGARVNAFSEGNRWNFVSDTRGALTNTETYGLGADSPSNQAVTVNYDYLRFYETAYRRIHPSVFAGVGFLYSGYSHIRAGTPGPGGQAETGFALHSEDYGLNPGTQTSAGASANVLFDNRDSSINPSRGSYADFKYEAYFQGFLNGSSTWQLSHSDLRTYLRLTKDARKKLAFWFFADLVTGGVAPYLDLPSTGDDTYGRSGRGYTPGRYRGERMLYGEVEYRQTLTENGLVGMVVFLNTETLSNHAEGEELFDSFATGGGTGLRLMLNKRSRTNLCIDFGVGKDGSRGFYAGLQEAF
jgi:hypothetical protein